MQQLGDVIGEVAIDTVVWRVTQRCGLLQVWTDDGTNPRYVFSTDIPSAVFELLLQGARQFQSRDDKSPVSTEAADVDELLEPPELQPVRGAVGPQTAPHIDESLREAIVEDGLD